MRLSLAPRLFRTARPPDVVLVQTSTPRGGSVSLGIEVNLLPAAIEATRRRGGLVIAQLNPRMPHTLGDAEISLDDVDLAIEVDVALPTAAATGADDGAAAIAAHIVPFTRDGATIQCGIGRVPDAVVRGLQSHRGLRVWSEMVADGVMALYRAGALDDAVPICTSFLCGSEGSTRGQTRTRGSGLVRTEVVNDPGRIAQQPGMLSINAALEVDLYCQANASYRRGEIYSGFGGQPDFVSGALHAVDGHAVIGLPSWHAPSGTSTIVPLLDAPATSFQHSVIVTEHGAAEVFGRTQTEQAALLISNAADPRARDELREAAREPCARVVGLQRPTAASRPARRASRRGCGAGRRGCRCRDPRGHGRPAHRSRRAPRRRRQRRPSRPRSTARGFRASRRAGGPPSRRRQLSPRTSPSRPTSTCRGVPSRGVRKVSVKPRRSR